MSIRMTVSASLIALTTGAMVSASAQPLNLWNASGARMSYSQESAPRFEPQIARESVQGDIRVGSEAIDPALRRQIVDYTTSAVPGSVIVDTANTYLYYVLGEGRAMRYSIGVGREGFTWSGTERVSRKAEWPDWRPPASMIARQPYLPRFVAGGEGNPLGARAIYLGDTMYRIHGTNAPETIGRNVSSGCIRMMNEDVIDLFVRVKVGASVTVLPNAQASVR